MKEVYRLKISSVSTESYGTFRRTNFFLAGLLPYVKLVDNFDAEYEYIANDGTLFTFKTNLKSPNYKLINIDFEKPEQVRFLFLSCFKSISVIIWCSCV